MDFFLFLSISVSACGNRVPLPYEQISGKAIGTLFHITYQPSSWMVENSINKHQVLETIDREISALNSIFSTYSPDSTLIKFNQSTSLEFQDIPPLLYARIDNAFKIHHFSDGLYDITVNPLYRAWNFYQKDNIRGIPGQEKITGILQHTGMGLLQLKNGKIRKTHPRIELDLSSIAKGFYVDYIAARFTQKYRIRNYLIEIGGEIIVKGNSPSGKPWRIALEKPLEDSSVPYRIIHSSSIAVATSGNYRNFYIYRGKKYSHIINPKTGYPVETRNMGVSVLHKSCEMADGYATAFYAMDIINGLERANREKIAVHYVTVDGDRISEYSSLEMQKYLH